MTSQTSHNSYTLTFSQLVGTFVVDKELLGAQDPYVIFEAGGQKCQTKVRHTEVIVPMDMPKSSRPHVGRGELEAVSLFYQYQSNIKFLRPNSGSCSEDSFNTCMPRCHP